MMENCNKTCTPHKGGCAGGAYGLGVIGAAVYFVQNADTFWVGVIGILKAIVWPALLVYHALKFFIV